jgi:glutamate-1-semialdehyde 2,1-aminomutase
LRSVAEKVGVPIQTVALGGMLGLFFSASEVTNFAEASACDHQRFASFFRAMLDRGVWMPPSPYEAMFVSAAHTRDDVQSVLDAAEWSLRQSTGRRR